MAKIIVKKNLRLVQSANNKNFPYDGVLTKDGVYYVTCIHGGEDGSLMLETNDIKTHIYPYNLKSVLNDKFCLQIDRKDTVYITPCNPKQVRASIGRHLLKNNIKILCNNWSSITGIVYYEGNFDRKQIKKTNVTILVGKYLDLKSACDRGTIQEMV